MLMSEWMQKNGSNEWQTLEPKDWDKIFALPWGERKVTPHAVTTMHLLSILRAARERYTSDIESHRSKPPAPWERDAINYFFKKRGDEFKLLYGIVWTKVKTEA